jgi:hypothetical protein
MVRYTKIDQATTALGYGTIRGYNDLRHGYGMTTTNHKVWLPIMYDPDNNWFNMYDNKNKDLIIQIANKEPAINAVDEWKSGILDEDAAHVIVRTNFDGKTYEYDDIGEYCNILFDLTQHIIIHAKLGTPAASGKKLHCDRLSWVSGFAASEIEARDKLDRLVRPTLKTLRGI